VPHFALAMRRRGHDDALIDHIVFDNPAAFLGQSPKFQLGDTRQTHDAPAIARSESDAAPAAGIAAA
jgi:hypothetical protein